MYAQQRSESELWDVPYLLVDPMDVGRTYEAIIRVNSQSGKGGVAYLMETEHHLELPRGLQIDFAQKVQAITDARGDELTADELLAAFHEHYLSYTRPYELVSYAHWSAEDDRIVAQMLGRRRAAGGRRASATGRSPRSSRRSSGSFGIPIRIRDYHEHAMAASADATAAAYVEADVDDDAVWGVGLHPSIVTASLRAVVNAVNRAIALREAAAPRRARSSTAALALARREPAQPGELGRLVEAERQEHERVDDVSAIATGSEPISRREHRQAAGDGGERDDAPPLVGTG